MRLRPYNTLYMIQSIDGKISTGVGDAMDFDKDLASLPQFKSGFDAYYEEEKKTDYWSLITDKIITKLGGNEGKFLKEYHNHGFIVWFNGHCSRDALNHVADNCDRLIIVQKVGCTVDLNKRNTRYCTVANTHSIDLVMAKLNVELDVNFITVQSGGTLNSALLRSGFIDRIVLYILPTIVGGSNTPSLADGEDYEDPLYALALRVYELNTVKMIKGGFLRLEYEHRIIEAQNKEGTKEYE